MVKRKYFGTDGIRGRIGSQSVNPDFVLKLGWAFGKFLRRQMAVEFASSAKEASPEKKQESAGTPLPTFASTPLPRVLIGKDTRVSGYMFESALQAGLISAGVDVVLTGPMPTPAIAYLTKTLNAHGGIVISASHNPHYDNGIKFFSADGYKFSDEIESKIEAILDEPLVSVESEYLGRADRLNADGRYIEFCKSTCKIDETLSGFKIVLDCANGATYNVAPAIFRELGAEVVTIHHKPDGVNINHGCGATDLTSLRSQVLETKADCGIAFDGDGDRVMMVDHTGAIIDGDQMLFILAVSQDRKPKGVVGTVLSNLGLEQSLTEVGIGFERAAVGDSYVMETLRQKKWYFGAEPSGHLIGLKYSNTGDGIIAALQVLKAMVQKSASLHDLSLGMKKVPQVMVSVAVKNKHAYEKDKEFQQALADATKELGDDGRILVRASGTEPKVRVMVEGNDAIKISIIVKSLAAILESE